MNSNNQLTSIIIEHAIHVHRTLGPGLLESAYKTCLAHSLSKTGLTIVKERPIPVVFEEITMECGYRADLIVERKVIVEVKSVDALAEIHKAQLLTYLRLTNIRFGLLINFNVLLLKDGVRRIVNGY